jgi:hypothetical protein
MIAVQLSHDDFDCHTHDVSCSTKSESNWQDWVYKESRRRYVDVLYVFLQANGYRLAVIYRILNKLIFFGPAAMCDMPSEFVIAPLPARRQLWEAAHAQEWQVQKQREPLAQVSYALAADGEIVKLDQGRLSCRDAWLPYAQSSEKSSPNRASSLAGSGGWWAEWCSGMDSMGGLIMLAASMA